MRGYHSTPGLDTLDTPGLVGCTCLWGGAGIRWGDVQEVRSCADYRSDELLEAVPAPVVVEGGGDGVTILVLLHLPPQAAPLAPAGEEGVEGRARKGFPKRESGEKARREGGEEKKIDLVKKRRKLTT